MIDWTPNINNKHIWTKVVVVVVVEGWRSALPGLWPYTVGRSLQLALL